jgi:tyrosine-protein phosphatase SIW14
MKNAILILSAIFLCSCSTTVVTHGIPNLHQVENRVWRGGQPENLAAWQYLHDDLGILFDLKLNTEKEASDDLAKQAGMVVVKFPITTWEQTLGMPKTFALLGAVSVIEGGKEGGIYVHCQHGQDRTGLVIGAYRVESEHWTKAEAYKEMKWNGFHPELDGLYQAWLYQVKVSTR